MSDRKSYEDKMRGRLDGLKSEIAELREKAEQAEINLELECYTLIDELQLKLEAAEHRFELLRLANEENWEAFKAEFEQSWNSLREVIRAITAP